MVMKVIWSSLAKSRLKQVYGYYAEKVSVKVAKSITQSILDSIRLLRKNPQLGKVEETPEGLETYRELRCLIEGDYKIVYRVMDMYDAIDLVTIFYTYRDPDKMLEED
jgi:plasmid stabilization system protein ParE